MTEDEFKALQPGDMVRLRGHYRTVKTLHRWGGDVHMVEYNEGDNTKIGDPWLNKIQITHKGE